MSKTCNYENCSNFVFGAGYCKYHQYCRTDKKRVPRVREHRPIKPISKKQATLNQEYSQERITFLEEHPLCIAKLLGCTRIATDVHHKRGRGKFFLDKSTWIGLCRSCHQKVEENPAMAREKGLSDSRLNE
jgi:hypothetical protein